MRFSAENKGNGDDNSDAKSASEEGLEHNHSPDVEESVMIDAGVEEPDGDRWEEPTTTVPDVGVGYTNTMPHNPNINNISCTAIVHGSPLDKATNSLRFQNNNDLSPSISSSNRSTRALIYTLREPCTRLMVIRW